MPPKKARPRPSTWKVTGGAQSGGLIVRQGSETKSPECDERLATGSFIQELELQGERMRYALVRGSGPSTGWIGTKFKGKDLLQRRPLKAWIIATGTRGDIQPYLALACGMKDAGYEMTIWTCEDYRSFVENYGIRMQNIAGSVEDMIRSMNDGKDQKVKKGNKDQANLENPANEEEQKMTFAYKMLTARWFASLNHEGISVGGVKAFELMPASFQEQLSNLWCGTYYGEKAGILAQCGYQEACEKYIRECERYKELYEAEEEEKRKKAEEEAGDKEAEEKKGPRDGWIKWLHEDGELDWDLIRRHCEENPEGTLARVGQWADWEHHYEQAEGLFKTYCGIHNFWLKDRKGADDPLSVMVCGIEGLFLKDVDEEPEYLDGLMREVERNPPDICLYNCFWFHAATQVQAKCDIPVKQLHLQPTGIKFSDPHAKWLTEETWPVIKGVTPEFMDFQTLEEARSHCKNEMQVDFSTWARYVALEKLIFTDRTGQSPILDMGPIELHSRLTSKSLVGFLSSIASDRFIPSMGDFSVKWVAQHKYTGFWIMPEKHQTGAGSSSMFGGPELMKKVEDFLAAGDKPAYIGWGSCICQKGRLWMIFLAVGALKSANMRGIILGGWADLTLECLKEAVGDEDSLGLVEYARKNVLFVEKAPQVWLFPKCSVVVIHGGVGTLAAAWRSGTPLIICPVWLDQFENQWLNLLMSQGILCPRVDDCGIVDLAGYLQRAVTDPLIKRGAEAVQFSMMMDKGIDTAMECIDDIILQDVPTGKWKEWHTNPWWVEAYG